MSLRARREGRRAAERRAQLEPLVDPTCRVCGCTDADCTGCVERTGHACWWLEPDLCSACGPAPAPAA